MLYHLFENKIESIKINSHTDLWDDVILPLLDSNKITESEAEEAFNDIYLNELLYYMKLDCNKDEVVHKYYVDEHELYYKRMVL